MQTTLTSNGRVIDQDPTKFGRLRESSEHAADGTVLRERLSEDGYVFLRDVLDTQVLLRVQQIIADELHRLDAIDPDVDRAAQLFPARPGLSLYKVLAGISQEERRALTRQPELHSIFRAIFGEGAKPLDYTWPRIAGPGRGELPHSDWIYMRRGTPRLYTAWIPLMDLPLSHGPLMILENSHHDNPHTRRYLDMDVGKLGYFDAARFKHGTLVHGGRYSRRPDRVREEFGTRWLSTDYRLGDVIIFSTRGLHATLDNRSKGFRMSIDVRFQPARDVTDPRFEGSHPIADGARDNIFDRAIRVRDGLRRYLGRGVLGAGCRACGRHRRNRARGAFCGAVALAHPRGAPSLTSLVTVLNAGLQRWCARPTALPPTRSVKYLITKCDTHSRRNFREADGRPR